MLAVFLTHAVHSAIWSAAALAMDRASLAPGARHVLFKAAVLGPLVTAGVAHVALAADASGSLVAASIRESGRASALAVPSVPTMRLSSIGHEGWWTVASMVLAAAIAIGLARLGASALALHRALRGRRPATDERLLARFERLRASTTLGKVRLSMSARLGSPIVVGTREVCIPDSTATLDDVELDAVLAHELAHLERGDGLWFLVLGAVQSALWIQPLAAWAAGRARETAELACDDRAVELVGDPRALARALVAVAERAQACPVLLAPTAGGASRTLFARLERLTGAARPRPATWGATRAAGLVLVGAAVSTTGIDAARSSPALVVRAPSATTSRALEAAATTCADDLAALARRDRDLEPRWAAALAAPEAANEGSPAAQRAADLEQELRHVRETAAWMEERCASERADAPFEVTR